MKYFALGFADAAHPVIWGEGLTDATALSRAQHAVRLVGVTTVLLVVYTEAAAAPEYECGAESEFARVALGVCAASGNTRRAAEYLGMCRRTLDRRIVALGLRPWHRATYPLRVRQPRRRPGVSVAAGVATETRTGVGGALDVSVTVTLGGAEIMGEVTLLRHEDGRPGYGSWGQPDHWVSAGLLHALRGLGHDEYREVLATIEAAASAECGS